jgi:biopolymer transport protein ExbB
MGLQLFGKSQTISQAIALTSMLMMLPFTLAAETASEATGNELATTVPGPEAIAATDPTLFDRFNDGGWPMYFLLFLAILSVGIILERFGNLNRRTVSPLGLDEEADRLWQEDQQDAVVDLGTSDGSILGKALAYAAAHRDEGYELASEGAGEVASRELRRQLQSNYWLAVIATLAPLIGLLGTILGMIESFAVVAIAGEIGDIGTVAGGISKALITTAFGLIVAVPSLAGFHYFKGRVTKLSITLEEQSSPLLKRWLK